MATKKSKKAAKKSKKPAKKTAKPMKKAAKKTKPKKISVLGTGMQWVNPYLTVKDPTASMQFYERGLGFKRRFAMNGPDGRIMHAEVVHKTGVIMLSPPNPQIGDKPPIEQGVSPVTMYVYVDDVDQTTETARMAGANVVSPPQDMFWGDRIATVVDLDGHRWCLATHVKDVKPEDMRP
jgi:PhnB protein